MNWKLAEVLLYNEDYKNELGKTGKKKKKNQNLYPWEETKSKREIVQVNTHPGT